MDGTLRPSPIPVNAVRYSRDDVPRLLRTTERHQDVTANRCCHRRSGTTTHRSRVAAIAGRLISELGGGVTRVPALTQSIERDLGIDSLERVELLLRLERAFGVGLADSVMAEAVTLDDLVAAIMQSLPRVAEVLPARGAQSSAGASAPASAATLVDVLIWHAEHTPDRVHIHLCTDDKQTPLPYGELLTLVLLSPLTFLSRPSRWLSALHTYSGTLSAAPTFAFDLCVHKIADDEIQGLDLRRWRLAMNGSEAVSADTIERFIRRFAPCGFAPSAMCPVYGLAEASVALTMSPINRSARVDAVAREPFERRRDVRLADATDPTTRYGSSTSWASHSGSAPRDAWSSVDHR